MPDFEMCLNWVECDKASTCRRSGLVSNPGHMQAYGRHVPEICNAYWPWPKSASEWAVSQHAGVTPTEDHTP